MSTSSPAVRRNGFLNVLDIIVAPKAAFERIREVPAWGAAFLVASILAIIGAIIATPLVLTILDQSMPAQLAANPQIAKLPPDQQQRAIANGIKITKLFVQFGWLVNPIVILIGSAISALIFLIGDRIGKGEGSYRRYYAVAMHVAVVGTGIYYLLNSLIAIIRGPGAYDSMSQIATSLPGLAMLASGAPKALVGFLTIFNIVTLWAAWLSALGMQIVGRVKPSVAYATVAVSLILAGAFQAFGASRS